VKRLGRWAKVRPQIRASAPCATETIEACPSCRAGEPCPRDVLYIPVATIAILGAVGEMSRDRVEDHLLGKRPNRKINDWMTHPDVLAYMLWFIVDWAQRQGSASVGKYLAEGISRDFHLIEPRLALLACQMLVTFPDLLT